MKPLGKILVYGIPVWVIQLFLPLGFGLITLRLIWHASEKWRWRGVALALAAVVAGVAIWSPGSPERWMVPGLVALGLATLLGAPVFTALGGAALILFWGHDLPIQAVPLKHYSLTTNDMLPSIPIFTLAGYFLAESGASKRLVRVFQALVGQFRGGPAIVTALVCAFFTSFTGASGVTILALGGVLMPVLLAARYSERNALGLLTGAGSLGMLFPPCLPLILYAIVANHSAHADLTIKQMFLGGIGPGILLVIITAWWGIRQGPKEASARPAFRWSEAWAALWDAKWEMVIPVVAIGSLFTVPTTVEAAAVTATYALLVATVIHRDLRPIKDLPRVMTECGLLVGGVLLILGVALGFTHYLVDAQLPDQMVEWATAGGHLEMALPARPERRAALRRRAGGNLRGHRRGRAAAGAAGRGLWYRPHPPRDHLPRQHGAGLPLPAGRLEPAALLLPFQQADVRGHPRHVRRCCWSCWWACC